MELHFCLPPKCRYDNFNKQNPSVQSVRYVPEGTIRVLVPALHHHGHYVSSSAKSLNTTKSENSGAVMVSVDVECKACTSKERRR